MLMELRQKKMAMNHRAKYMLRRDASIYEACGF